MIRKIPLVFAALIMSCVIVRASAEVVAVVASSSDVKQMSAAQIADIFLGKSARFPDGTAAVPLDQKESSIERAEFYEVFAGKTPVEMKMHWSKLIFTGRGQPPRQLQDAGEIKALVAGDHSFIGYLDRSRLDATVRALEVR